MILLFVQLVCNNRKKSRHLQEMYNYFVNVREYCSLRGLSGLLETDIKVMDVIESLSGVCQRNCTQIFTALLK